jgi:hypothetical protein
MLGRLINGMGKDGWRNKCEKVRKRNIVGRESNQCCQRDATMPSLCTVVELRLSVNNITPLSVSTEKQERCRAAAINNIIYT